MRRSSLRVAPVIAFGFLFSLVTIAACSGSAGNSNFGGTDGGIPGPDGTIIYPGSGTGAGGSGTGGGITLGSGTGTGGGGGDGGSTTVAVCPPGLQCNVACGSGKTTSISGKVYDPAGKNALYGVAVYVPAVALTKLPSGVPTGSDACSCGALYASGAVTNTTTGVDGSFTLNNVPVGSNVPLVLQIGKWRRAINIPVTACTDNVQMGNTLKLPGTIPAGDVDDNMPDIAVSTGSADTLECLLVRMGISPAEYVAGNATTGHVHMFSGGGTGFGGGGGGGGTAESNPFPGSPVSSTSLWSSQAQLMPYDVVLLSCEGGETDSANPPALEAYLNAGGRAFGSHFHYSWFSGPISSSQSYSAPADWGTNLATWSADGNGGDSNGPVAGVIDQTLNGSSMPFQKGQILDQWLGDNGALGTDNQPAADLAIYQPRYNAQVGAANKPSQPWITTGSNTMYFSFDTPVNAAIPPGGTSPAYCGRAVFSDLHVAGNTDNCPSSGGGGGGGGGGETGCDNTKVAPPGSCSQVDLSPQEKALEFMLFDLSSCVVPDTMTVSPDAGLPPPPSLK